MKQGLWLFALIAAIAGPAGAEGFRFMVAGDTQTGQAFVDEIVQVTIDEGADFILICGDLTDSGTALELQRWIEKMQPLYDAGIGVYPVRGNHDSYDSHVAKSVWDSVFSGVYALPDNGPAGEENVTYSFTHKNTFIVGLDQFVTPYRNNLDWFEEQLASNDKPHVFVFGHTSAFAIYHPDAVSLFPRQRDIFVNNILAEGGRVYFCGHDHFYDHIRLDNGDGNPNNDLHQFILNSDSKMYGDGPYFGDTGIWEPVRLDHRKCAGYMVVDINDLEVTLTWKYRTSESLLDEGICEPGDTFTYTLTHADAPKLNIPDPNLRSAINAELAITEPDMDNILGLTYLDANSLGIFDLTGLEYAKNLEYAYLNDNRISRADSLTHLRHLRRLLLKDNPLMREFHCIDKQLILRENPDVDIRCDVAGGGDCVVDFADDNLKVAIENELGVSPATLLDLRELFYFEGGSGAGITDLHGLDNATHCFGYNLSGNSIEDISTLSNNTNLLVLDLSGNRIKDISALSDSTSLAWLMLDRNQIVDISALSNMTSLQYLELEGNPLNARSYCEDIPAIVSNNAEDLFIVYDPNPNALTLDCSTDFPDFAGMAAHWLWHDCSEDNNWCGGADLDHNANVNMNDLLVLSGYWLD